MVRCWHVYLETDPRDIVESNQIMDSSMVNVPLLVLISVSQVLACYIVFKDSDLGGG